MEKNIVIEKMESVPFQDSNSWRAILDRLDVGECFLIERKQRNTVSNTASMNFRHTSKVFRTSVKGQPEGKACVWREK